MKKKTLRRTNKYVMQFNSQWKTILVLCPSYLSFLFIFLKVVFVCQSRSKVWIQAGRYWMTMRLRLKRSSIAIDYLFNVLSRMTQSEKWRWKIYAPSAELWEVVQCRPLLHKVCFVSHFKYVTYPPKRQAGREGWGGGRPPHWVTSTLFSLCQRSCPDWGGYWDLCSLWTFVSLCSLFNFAGETPQFFELQQKWKSHTFKNHISLTLSQKFPLKGKEINQSCGFNPGLRVTMYTRCCNHCWARSSVRWHHAGLVGQLWQAGSLRSSPSLVICEWIHFVWFFCVLSACSEFGILVIMITLLVTAVAGPPEALELCCMLMMSPLVCSFSVRRKMFLTVAWGGETWWREWMNKLADKWGRWVNKLWPVGRIKSRAEDERWLDEKRIQVPGSCLWRSNRQPDPWDCLSCWESQSGDTQSRDAACPGRNTPQPGWWKWHKKQLDLISYIKKQYIYICCKK